MKKRIQRKLNSSTWIQGSKEVAKYVPLVIHRDISLYTAIKYIYEEFKQHDLFAESKSVAFNFTMAVFPGIIFMFTLVPYIEVIGITREQLLAFMQSAMPAYLYEGLKDTIVDLVDTKRNDLLSFGFLLSAFLSTNGMLALMGAFNRCYKTIDNRSFIKTRLIAFGLTGLMFVVLVLTLVLIVFGNLINEYIHHHLHLFESLDTARYLQFGAYFSLYFVAISMIYYIAPAVTERWKFISLGSITATLLSLMLSLGFSFYVNNFADYNKLYGSLGALIVFMIWVQWMAVILLVGFKINAGIDRARNEQKYAEENQYHRISFEKFNPFRQNIQN